MEDGCQCVNVSVTDANARGSLKDQSVTTTSANGLSVTTLLDTAGDGAFDQTVADARLTSIRCRRSGRQNPTLQRRPSHRKNGPHVLWSA
jgi:hypothetical protein